jgi:hypothetical protein
MGVNGQSKYGQAVWKRSTDQEYDVTMTRPDSVFGPVTSTRRIFATSRKAAIEQAVEEFGPHHVWTLAGVHCYTGELGR